MLFVRILQKVAPSARVFSVGMLCDLVFWVKSLGNVAMQVRLNALCAKDNASRSSIQRGGALWGVGVGGTQTQNGCWSADHMLAI